MTTKTLILIISLTLLGYQANPPPQPKQSIAQLLIGKGLLRINDPERNNILADLHSINENNSPPEEDDRIITGRPKLVDDMSIEELYRAFASRFEFYIDDTDSAKEINGKTYGVIKYRPKSNLNIRKTADQLINRVSGNVYMDLDTFFITRIEGSVDKPFSFKFRYWFIPLSTVHVYKFKFFVEYAVFNDIVVEEHLGGWADFEHTYRNRGIKSSIYFLSNYKIKT